METLSLIYHCLLNTHRKLFKAIIVGHCKLESNCYLSDRGFRVMLFFDTEHFLCFI